MYLVTIQPKPIQVLVDTLNADLAEEMVRQYLNNKLCHGNSELFYVDMSDAKVEKSNEVSFGSIFKVI